MGKEVKGAETELLRLRLRLAQLVLVSSNRDKAKNDWEMNEYHYAVRRVDGKGIVGAHLPLARLKRIAQQEPPSQIPRRRNK